MFSIRWKKKPSKTEGLNLGRLPLRRSKIAIERLSRFALFSADAYSAQNPDIGAMPSAMHFIGYGADECRMGATPVHMARLLGQCASHRPPPMDAPPNQPLTVGLYVSSLSNVFMHEIAACLAHLLTSAGHHVVEADENSNIELRPEHCIYVAPHEFFLLGRGREWVRDDVLATACMYCTEQVQTSWFWQSLHIVLMARSVVDMSLPLASAFSEVMPSACIFPSIGTTPRPVKPDLLNHPMLRGQRWWTSSLADQCGRKRPLDLCFFGTVSPHRSRFFARNAERLSRYESLIYLRTRNAHAPMNAGSGEHGLIDVAQLVTQNARILLNVHRDEFPYFEWHRLVYQGMANRTVVVSEPCFCNPDFEAGVHYLAEDSRHLVTLAEWVLNDPDGQEKAKSVAEAAFAANHKPDDEAARARALVGVLTA